jgi:hypothetical protein
MMAGGMVLAMKRVVKRLKEAGALSPKTARPLPDLRPMQRVGLRHLLRHDIVRKARSDTYYLDEPAWEDHLSQRRRLGFFLAAAGLLLGFIVFASLWK